MPAGYRALTTIIRDKLLLAQLCRHYLAGAMRNQSSEVAHQLPTARLGECCVNRLCAKPYLQCAGLGCGGPVSGSARSAPPRSASRSRSRYT